MNLGVLKKIALKIGEEIVKHQAEILLVGGTVTAVGATAMAVKATIKSTKEVQEENLRREENDIPVMTKKEVVKSEAKNYIWTLIFLMTSLASQFGSYKASIRRIAVLSTALKLSEETYNEYRKEVEEAAKIPKEDLKQVESKAVNTAVDNVLLSGDTEYEIRIDGSRIRKNVSELKLDLEKFRSDYYLSGYQDPVTVADLHDYLGLKTYPSDYDRKISFTGGADWYTLMPTVENSKVFIDIDYVTRDIERY